MKNQIEELIKSKINISKISIVDFTDNHQNHKNYEGGGHFQAVIISDDLEMKAVADRYTMKEMVELGMKAGVDHFLACKEPEVVLELYRAIIRSVEDEVISHEDLLKKAKRVRKWRSRFYKAPVPPSELKKVGCEEHQLLAQEILTRKMMATT